jgi:uncharacterized DUF497 family protein
MVASAFFWNILGRSELSHCGQLDGDFEWDDAKAAENYAKHGVSFEMARAVFTDAFGVEAVDDRENYGEERLILIGMAEDVLLFVVYTDREDHVRLISARRATRHKQDEYYERNG